MRHYCTYFDGRFLSQGLAMWRSLARWDTGAILWVLTLDDYAHAALLALRDPRLRVTNIVALEAADSALVSARGTRSRIEYFFTLSPCWPCFLLDSHAEIDRLTYLDADLFFFGNPGLIFEAMDSAHASVLITEHRFPKWLKHYERHGKYNVGILCFRNDASGRLVLDHWRDQCLAWCYDRIEGEKYADQKYLNEWPQLFGAAVHVFTHPGFNLAPWNWAGHDCIVLSKQLQEAERGEDSAVCRILVDGCPLFVFHFAALRRLGRTWWNSGQLDYGVMNRKLREAIYAPYLQALEHAAEELNAVGYPSKSAVSRKGIGVKRFVVSIFFGSIWRREADAVRALGGGPWSRKSGYWLALWKRDVIRL